MMSFRRPSSLSSSSFHVHAPTGARARRSVNQSSVRAFAVIAKPANKPKGQRFSFFLVRKTVNRSIGRAYKRCQQVEFSDKIVLITKRANIPMSNRRTDEQSSDLACRWAPALSIHLFLHKMTARNGSSQYNIS